MKRNLSSYITADDILRNEKSLLEFLTAKHGPLMSGEPLWRFMSFKTAAEFRQAVSQGRLGVPNMKIENSRDTFVITADLVEWYFELNKLAGVRQKPVL